jgi:hypothetical protein
MTTQKGRPASETPLPEMAATAETIVMLPVSLPRGLGAA